MHFSYCPHCGSKLIDKEIGDEGMLPFCEECHIPLWDMFSTCVICAVVNEYNEVALIRQNYVTTENYVCIAGFIKPEENAEEAAMREIKEEIGLNVREIQYIRSYYYPKKQMLMLGFMADISKDDFTLSGEVDGAAWFPFSKVLSVMREGSIAWQLVKEVMEVKISQNPQAAESQ